MPNTKIEEGIASVEQKVVFVGDPQAAPRFYGNHASIQTTIYDVRIQSNQIVEQNPDRVEVVPQLILHLSHVHAKKLATVILEHLSILEQKFGKVMDGPVATTEKEPS